MMSDETRAESLKALLALVAFCMVVVTAPSWLPWLGEALQEEAAPAVQVRPIPFAEAMQCPPWRPGLSRTLAVIATEDETGGITELRCIRAKVREPARAM